MTKTNYENKFNKKLFNKTSYGPKKNCIFKHNNEYCSINAQEQLDSSKLFSMFHEIKSRNINKLSNLTNIDKNKDIKGKKYRERENRCNDMLLSYIFWT